MLNIPLWLAALETVGFVIAIVTIIYNRIVSVGHIKDTVQTLKAQFEQYQKDMQHYLDICELCRTDVRKHHEDQTERHVTPSMRDQINALVSDVSEIKRYLMEHK